MPQALITERYAAEIQGVLHCYDRIVISGQLQPLCYAKGMTKYLYVHGIRIFDYTQFAEPLRDAIRQHAEALAQRRTRDAAGTARRVGSLATPTDQRMGGDDDPGGRASTCTV